MQATSLARSASDRTSGSLVRLLVARDSGAVGVAARQWPLATTPSRGPLE
jgi:hypothetical protein